MIYSRSEKKGLFPAEGPTIQDRIKICINIGEIADHIQNGFSYEPGDFVSSFDEKELKNRVTQSF